ncbi:hypothetical protein D2U50_10080 [Salmonella enterica]|nr:hypothetical protein [Salmonella enterica]ECC9516748.1 hypothetical protein [Salmonella enterica subsp. enterica]EBI7890667.1 hypothetical protein [Salmonella enterica]EBJ6051259.1 hypothetical protein [Salmonella enterica]EBK7889991.1 hypothetical protein [Salmonella enterica]
MSLIFTPAQAISLVSPNPASAHKTQRVLNVRKDGPVGVSFANHPHVLQYAPVAVRWRYPV